MSQPRYPKGWDEARVRRVLEHYESQSPEEVIAEDEYRLHLMRARAAARRRRS